MNRRKQKLIRKTAYLMHSIQHLDTQVRPQSLKRSFLAVSTPIETIKYSLESA